MGGENGGDNIIFICADGRDMFRMYHEQDCCESVTIESIDGDLQDLVGQTVIEASERTENDTRTETKEWGSGTWTFYVIRTVKASVTIRWIGTSNGYYSESVSFVKCKQ